MGNTGRQCAPIAARSAARRAPAVAPRVADADRQPPPIREGMRCGVVCTQPRHPTRAAAPAFADRDPRPGLRRRQEHRSMSDNPPRRFVSPRWPLLGPLVLLFLSYVVIGTVLVTVALAQPGTLALPDARALARVSALASYLLLWLSVAGGLALSGRTARSWPGLRAAYHAHRYAGLAGLALALFHTLMLAIGPRAYPLRQVLIPFEGPPERAPWALLGQFALYGLIAATLAAYARPWIGRRRWHALHALTVVAFALALAHGLGGGPHDPTHLALYLASGLSVALLLSVRLARAFRARTGR
jgi:DMSO/TMAO reductase YedYZ heme-binding membrane subunit